LGGWLCLEDWFYSGSGGRYVMTHQPAGQGACLPPALPRAPEPWPSEGILTKRLNDSEGADAAAAALAAHRHSFISNSDLENIAELGIQKVRLPLTWAAFADALKPIDAGVYGAHDPDKDTVIVPDPFYAGTTAWATIPRNWLKEFLHRAADNHLQILFDLHAFPAGSSDGTYSGVWPAKPMFWTEKSSIGNRSVALSETGLWVAKALISWLEALDERALSAVAGVSLMNEPAHMAATDAKDPAKAFASESDVLAWLEASSQLFRASSLPGRGKRLYMQIIETAFKDFDGTVIPWFNRVFSAQEQSSWAVIDRHWYIAWNPVCDGRTQDGGGYLCDQPLDEVRSTARTCVRNFTEDFAKKFHGLKATSEFSVGTYQDAWFACNDKSTLGIFLEEQISAFGDAGIEPFFWSWRMPYGPVFEPGWSLKRLAGFEDHPPAEQCLQPPSSEAAFV